MLDDTEGLPLDLPPGAEAALKQAGQLWHQEAAAEAKVKEALALAPDALAARIGAYKFYFYRHRLDEALPHARSCVAFALEALGLGEDWQCVRPGDAAFVGSAVTLAPLPKLLMQTLIATGYVLARLGRIEESEAHLSKVVELDPGDRLGAGRMLAVVRRGGVEEEEGP
jgi:tetratricopeptide (TPR) repeat protein